MSGAQAGERFRTRTQAGKGTCHRSQELDNIEALEERHEAVVYLWVHSHVGITPNEAADALCDEMRDGMIAELDLAPSRFHLLRVDELKRGSGRVTLEVFDARLRNWLVGEVHHTLLPTSGTWPVFANVRKHKVMREVDQDTLVDARANRCGLLADRLVCGPVEKRDDGSEAAVERRRAYRPKKGTWEWCRQRCNCPSCGTRPDASKVHASGIFATDGPRQTMWHVLTECSPEDAAIGGERARAAEWLARRAADFGTKQAEYALAAITGGAAALNALQQHAALRFLLGLPDEPMLPE